MLEITEATVIETDEGMTVFKPVSPEWWVCIARHIHMVSEGHISGEWADPISKGWKPPLVQDGKILPSPHHD